jgi:hypothetical protein
MICQANQRKKKATKVILISDKVGFKSKLVIRDNEGHYILTNEESIKT